MISLLVSGLCLLGFLVFELFYQALDRLSPIKLRGLLDEHPKTLSLLAGREEPAVVKTTLKVLVQILLLAGLWTLIRGLASLEVPAPWALGGAVFLLGWLLIEGALLRLVSRSAPEKLLPRLHPVLSAFSWIIRPLAWPVRAIFDARTEDEGPASDEEIQAYIEVGREEGILEREEEKLLLSIVDFGDTTVKEVMTPRTDLVAVEEGTSLDRVADLFVETKYSRLPVYRESIDHVTGILHVKDVFEAVRRNVARSLPEISRPVHFVPETKKTAELLREFQRKHLAIAVVVDEYGSVSGLVTIEDLLEEIVGEIADEHEDEGEAVVELPGGAFSISGKTHVEILHELFGRGPKNEAFDTLGGFLAARLGRIPKVGERREEDSLRFTVEEADRRRVLRVRVEPVAEVAIPAADA
ncbi:MAG: hemolysin family protein [Thermoanaerobaculia bacterium]